MCIQTIKSEAHRHTKESLLQAYRKVHGDTYTYDNYNFDNYRNWKSKITITCKIHGDFQQESNSHIQGCGCKWCSLRAVNKFGGLTNLTDPEKIVTLYFIELSGKDNDLKFLKVGLTSQDLNIRLKRMSGFDKTVLASFELKAKDAVKLETKILNHFYKDRYILSRKVFKGCTELFKCSFRDIIMDYIQNEIRMLTEKTVSS